MALRPYWNSWSKRMQFFIIHRVCHLKSIHFRSHQAVQNSALLTKSLSFFKAGKVPYLLEAALLPILITLWGLTSLIVCILQSLFSIVTALTEMHVR